MSKTDKELILEVTQAEYDEAMKKGWTDDDIQKPGKHRFRRTTRVAEPEDVSPSNIKVQITLRVDLDILEYFKKRASASHAAPYQTQINSELRKIMENDSAGEKPEIKKSIEELTANKEFIRAVAERLKEMETA
jgi:uncharacterized protein (DUF4415 family)